MVLVVSLLLFSGCASTKMTLNLALFKEDTKYLLPPTPYQIEKYFSALNDVGTQTDKLAKDKIELANDLFQTNKNYSAWKKKRKFDTEYDPKELKDLRRYLSEHNTEIQTKADKNKVAINDARRKLTEYIEGLESKQLSRSKGGAMSNRILAMESLNKVGRSFRELANPPSRTNFDRSLTNYWSTIIENVSQDTLVKSGKGDASQEFSALKKSVGNLAVKIEKIQKEGRKVSKQFKQSIEALSQFVEEKTVQGQMPAITTEDIPSVSGLNSKDREIITNLSMLYSQIDRLQDAGDPIWRVVTSSENEKKWNTQFSDTYFYAEGNNSVVVVRDTPMSFRVQRGNNNPAALIKGQLQVSRAIGSAAISIAGAATGVNLSSIASTGGNPPPGETDSAKSEDLARRKAAIEQKAKLRLQKLKSFRQNLVNLQSLLTNAPDDDPNKINSLIDHFKAILKAHKTQFTPTDSPK